MQLAHIFSVIHLTKVSTSNPSEQKKKKISSSEEHTLPCCQYLQLGTSVKVRHQLNSGCAKCNFGYQCALKLRHLGSSQRAQAMPNSPNPWLLPSTRRWALCRQPSPKGLLLSFPPTSLELQVHAFAYPPDNATWKSPFELPWTWLWLQSLQLLLLDRFQR